MKKNWKQKKDQWKLTGMIFLIKRKDMESTTQITLNISQEGRKYDYIIRKKIVRKSFWLYLFSQRIHKKEYWEKWGLGGVTGDFGQRDHERRVLNKSQCTSDI